MIGIFDSGFGGLSILKEIVKFLPEYSYIYLGDNARAPYGSLDEDMIYKYTVEGVDFLFKQGADIIILACNTSSAVALRKIQQQYLPAYYPGKKVLGIIIPTVEEVVNQTTAVIGVLGTEATIYSKSFQKEIAKINPDIKVFGQACPLFVGAIEIGNYLNKEFESVIKNYLTDLLDKSADIKSIILGCTHYALIEEQIKKFLPPQIEVISQGNLIAMKLEDYLKRHGEVRPEKGAKRIFFTTGQAAEINDLACHFYGGSIKFNKLSF